MSFNLIHLLSRPTPFPSSSMAGLLLSSGQALVLSRTHSSRLHRIVPLSHPSCCHMQRWRILGPHHIKASKRKMNFFNIIGWTLHLPILLNKRTYSISSVYCYDMLYYARQDISDTALLNSAFIRSVSFILFWNEIYLCGAYVYMCVE